MPTGPTYGATDAGYHNDAGALLFYQQSASEEFGPFPPLSLLPSRCSGKAWPSTFARCFGGRVPVEHAFSRSQEALALFYFAIEHCHDPIRPPYVGISLTNIRSDRLSLAADFIISEISSGLRVGVMNVNRN